MHRAIYRHIAHFKGRGDFVFVAKLWGKPGHGNLPYNLSAHTKFDFTIANLRNPCKSSHRNCTCSLGLCVRALLWYKKPPTRIDPYHRFRFTIQSAIQFDRPSYFKFVWGNQFGPHGLYFFEVTSVIRKPAHTKFNFLVVTCADI